MTRLTLARLCRAAVWLAVLFAFGAAALPAHAGTLSSDLQALIAAAPLSLQPIPVVVRFSRSTVDANLLALLSGGVCTQQFKLINGAAMLIPRCLVTALSVNSAVAHVSLDLPVAARDAYVYDYDTQTTGATQVWGGSVSGGGYTGTGVGIAVLDTGISSAADFSQFGTTNSRLVSFVDLVNGKTTPYDDNGHGTHVAGIALGSGNQSGGVISGEAPNANLISVKVLGEDGTGSTSSVIAGLDWCAANRASLGIQVVNLSLGHTATESYQTDPLCAAVRGAVQAGMTVVCAAGNKGEASTGATYYGGIDSPGIEPSAITVGALNTCGTPTRSDDWVDTYSSRGPTYADNLPKPDLVAPGNDIISVRAPGSYLDTHYPGNQVQFPGSATTDYFELSGTSMASPQVAGIIALMLQANGGLQPNTIKAILMYTAQTMSLHDASGVPLSPLLSLYTQGAGSVNAVGAVMVATAVNSSAPLGQPWLSASLPDQTTIQGITFPWTQQLAWGSGILGGTDLLGINQPAWTGAGIWSTPADWSGTVAASGFPSPSPGVPPAPTPAPAPPGQITWSDSTINGD